MNIFVCVCAQFQKTVKTLLLFMIKIEKSCNYKENTIRVNIKHRITITNNNFFLTSLNQMN